MSLTNVVVIDCETQGLEPPAARVIEIGAVLWNVEHRAIVDCHTALIRADGTNAAEPFNGIKASLLLEAEDADATWMIVEQMASRADAVIAHSAAFDKKFVEYERQGEVEHLLRLPWICTLEDVDWPGVHRMELGRAGSGSLIRLALAHGAAVVSAHRSIHDCLLLARIMEAVPDIAERLEVALARSQRPKASFIATVPMERNNEVKLAGFHWDRDREVWHRYCAIEDAEQFAFDVVYEEEYLAGQHA
jgi:DNA polymerase III epsilon subunit-like protein